MYNEELKIKFIKEFYGDSEKASGICYALFNATQPFEEKWGADLCTKSGADAEELVEAIIGFREHSKWTRLTMLKRYVKWCVSIKVPGSCDGFSDVRPSGINKMRNQTVVSPLHLEKFFNTIYDPADEQTNDNMHRCFYWLAYAGVEEEDILNIKCEDVDFNRMVIRYNGMYVPIYREAIPAFKNCVELKQFAYKHPHYTSVIWRDRMPGDALIRGIRSELSVTSFRNLLSRSVREKTKEGESVADLSYYRIWLSGVFYRAYERELIGETPTFRDLAAERVERKKTSHPNSSSREKKIENLAREYRNDYNRWKLAFNL